MTEVTKEDAEGVLFKSAKRVTESDINKVISKQKEIEDKFKSDGPLGQFLTDLKVLFSMLRDYASGTYREIPFWSIAAVAAALLYVLSPIDLIPDFIPGVGYIDDGLVVAVCLTMVKEDLATYVKWKSTQG